MKLRKWLENWDMKKLQIKAGFLEMEWAPQEEDKNAAWDMYVELLTRITTQSLSPQRGDEKTALDSIYSLFTTTRQILRAHGRDCINFTKIAVIVLNQIIRPFTEKWHRLSLEGAFAQEKLCLSFRKDLSDLQMNLRKYAAMLADMAGVENLTNLDGVTDK